MSCSKTNKPPLDRIPIKKYKYKKTFDASTLNRCYSGQFTLAWNKKSDCELISTKNFKVNPLTINGKQYQIKLLNLGNGQFREKKDFYTIKTIGKNVFKGNKDIGETLVVPTTIKTIDQNAFANTTIKNICIKNATDFLPINNNVFTGCKINKIITHNDFYKSNIEWNKICKNIISKPYTPSDYEKFMSRRTFQIGGLYLNDEKTDNSTRISGTAWFVDKVNRNDDNDYKYWIATNLHMCCAVSEYKNRNFNKLVNAYIRGKHFFYPKNDEEIPNEFRRDWNEIDIPIKVKIDSIKNVNQNFNQDFCIMEIEINPNLLPDDIPSSKRQKIKQFYHYDSIPSYVFENMKKNLANSLNALNRNLLLNNSFVVYTTDVLKDQTKIYSLGFGGPKNEYSFQEGEIYFNQKGFTDAGAYLQWVYGIRNSNKTSFGSGASGSMIINQNFDVVGIHHSHMESKISYCEGEITNLSDCLHVNDKYNPIAKFLQD